MQAVAGNYKSAGMSVEEKINSSYLASTSLVSAIATKQAKKGTPSKLKEQHKLRI